jgi:hypothetical protein
MSLRAVVFVGFAVGCGCRQAVDVAEICVLGEEGAAGRAEIGPDRVEVGDPLLRVAASSIGCNRSDAVVDDGHELAFDVPGTAEGCLHGTP